MKIGEIGEVYIELFLKIWYFCDPLDVYDSNINLVDNRWKPIFAVSNYNNRKYISNVKIPLVMTVMTYELWLEMAKNVGKTLG